MAEEGKHPGGRPPISEDDKKAIVSKLEPYLKSGLGISKALGEAKIVKASFYRIMQEDEEFRDKINQFRNFVAVLANNAIIKELMTITAKQNPGNGKKPTPLSKEDRKFLQWFVTTSSLTKEEFGERKTVELFDPEAEIQKVKGLIDEAASDEISHDDE